MANAIRFFMTLDFIGKFIWKPMEDPIMPADENLGNTREMQLNVAQNTSKKTPVQGFARVSPSVTTGITLILKP